jgi:hypothetical protein
MLADPNLLWGIVLTAGAAYETFALVNRRDGDTLSARTRAWFRVDTKPGRAIFTVAWGGFALWFLQHILTQSM